jgi:ribosome-associated protein
MDSKKISETISEILNEKKASNLDVVYVRNKTVIADYFVVATGTSTTHVKALADEVAFVMKDQYRIIPERIEGISTSRWILIDYRDVVVHIFHPEERENYSLEKLWATRPEDPMIADGLSDIKN